MNIKLSTLFTRIIFLLFIMQQCLCAAIDLDTPIKRIVFLGVSGSIQAKVPAFSHLTEYIGHRWQPYELSKAISDLYLSGYFQEVQAETISSKDVHTLVFRLVENPKISQITIVGNTQFSDDLLRSKLKTQLNEPYNLKIVAEDIRILEEYYHRLGYDFMRVDQTNQMGTALQFVIFEGKISGFSIDGLSTIEPQVAYREFRGHRGSVFNSLFLREDRERLLRTGYFSDISYPKLQDYVASSNQVSVSFTVKEQKVNNIELGLEQTQRSSSGQNLDQIVLFVKNNWNHIFISSDLLSSKIQYGNDYDNQLRITSYSFRYFQPWTLNRYPFSSDFQIWEEYRDEFAGRDPNTQEIVKSRRFGQQASFSFPLIQDRFTMITKLKNEDVAPLEVKAGTQPYSLRSLGVQWVYRDYTDINNPKWGQFWGLELEKGGHFGWVNLNGLNYSRISLGLKQFVPLNDTIVLGAYAFAGVFDAPGLTFSTFETEAFSLGGSNSIRGYKESGAVIGTHKLSLNTELRYSFSSEIQGVIFYDMGRAFDVGSFWSKKGIRSGRGVGIRFFTPIAPIRFDFSWGDHSGLIIHFGLGQVF